MVEMRTVMMSGKWVFFVGNEFSHGVDGGSYIKVKLVEFCQLQVDFFINPGIFHLKVAFEQLAQPVLWHFI